jgi:hypothetical protein
VDVTFPEAPDAVRERLRATASRVPARRRRVLSCEPRGRRLRVRWNRRGSRTWPFADGPVAALDVAYDGASTRLSGSVRSSRYARFVAAVLPLPVAVVAAYVVRAIEALVQHRWLLVAYLALLLAVLPYQLFDVLRANRSGKRLIRDWLAAQATGAELS